MDRKSIIILLLSILLMMGWSMMVNRIWPPQPLPPPTNTLSRAQSLTNQPPTPPRQIQPATNLVTISTNVGPAKPESLLTLENYDANYVFTSRGGGLKLVELKAYPATVACGKNTDADPSLLASVNTKSPLPILSLSAPFARPDDSYDLVKTAAGIKATRNFDNGLVIEKTFQPTSNYLVRATVNLRNTRAQALDLPTTEWGVGAATPTSPSDEAHLGIFWYDGDDTTDIQPRWFANRTLGCFPGKPHAVYIAGGSNTVWGAVHNQFFTIALAPVVPAQRFVAREMALPPYRKGEPVDFEPDRHWLLTTNDVRNPNDFIARLVRQQDAFTAYLVDRFSPQAKQRLSEYTGSGPFPHLQFILDDLNRLLVELPLYEEDPTFFPPQTLSISLLRLIADKPTGVDRIRLNRLLFETAFGRTVVASPMGLHAALTYPPVTLDSGQTLTRDFYIYAGPREYNTLARIGSVMENNLDGIMGYDGFFGFFAKALLLGMTTLHGVGLSYALAIITITIIIKILFWPLTNASTKSMKRMSALQPQMKEIQAKYKEDPAKMNRKMMEFMKEHKVSPLGGCLPMLLQLPVFFGFFKMIRSAIELRGAEFLWVCDLSQPDTLFMIPGFNWPFNLLPLIMGGTMLWQARLTPASPGMDPAQQKIMKYMPLMFLAILYNFSAGLTLYWTVQNLLTIAQMKLTRARDQATPAQLPPKPAAATLLPTKKRKKKKKRK